MMIMKIAIIAPRHYIDELQSYYKPREGVDLHYIHEESIQGSSLNKVTRTLLQQNFDGYIGLVDWSSLYSAYLNHRIGAPSPSPELLAKLQDKLLSRKIQNKYIKNRVFAADTRNLKQNINIEWPLFVKPRRASMSYLAEVVEDYEKLESITSENVREKLSVKNKKWKELYDFIDAPKSVAEGIDGFVAEELLMHGIQVTLDGFVQNRKVIFFGFTKSVFLPNHVSFKRFDYPYKFSRKLQRKLNRHARKLIKGSRFNHSLFNIEYKVDLKENKFEIVEINTRPSSQFMTPIEMVMGAHPLDVAIDIVQGKKVKLKLPKKLIASQVYVYLDKNVMRLFKKPQI